ncbi:MAG: DUF805 domain-containing protein [Cryomorphaceae bacterium]|jgi:uncharacterized membrane protein YhaH (DUF805 family)|nr:DUF805 domain-containing protein [Cryomorphaceae bacterium]
MNYYLKVLQNYANFNGRARRAEYWYFVLFNMIASIIVGIIGGLIDFELLGNLYSLAVLLPSIAVGVRRMHDVGKSGWFILIPIYNFILAVTEGDAGENEYGPDPKGQSSSDLLDA